VGGDDGRVAARQPVPMLTLAVGNPDRGVTRLGAADEDEMLLLARPPAAASGREERDERDSGCSYWLHSRVVMPKLTDRGSTRWGN
jgi:hypothetical protein